MNNKSLYDKVFRKYGAFQVHGAAQKVIDLCGNREPFTSNSVKSTSNGKSK